MVHHAAVALAAGGSGAAIVYPADMLKTRVQADTCGVLARLPWPKALAALAADGTLFAGLPTQLAGVAPEKALKLSAYSAALPHAYAALGLGDPTLGGWMAPDVGAEMLAGACAGFAQVLVTCPLEALKIGAQLGGDARDVRAYDRDAVVMTWARDVPSAALFFGAYTPLHVSLLDSGLPAFWAALISGVIAGVPAAALPTPADVVKTRLQTPGAAYADIADCLEQTLSEGGPSALAAGMGARVARLSPQLGITLAVYAALGEGP